MNEARLALFFSFILIPFGAWHLWSVLTLGGIVLVYILTKNMNFVVVVGSIVAGLALHSAVTHTATSHPVYIFPVLGYWGYSAIYWLIAFWVGIDY